MNILRSKITRKDQRGYTLLFAVLTASVVIGVAVFILSISRGQFLLASAARESTYAIYAADSGIECAANVASDLSTSSLTSHDMDCFDHTGGNTNKVSVFTDDIGGVTFSVDGLNQPWEASTTINLGDGRCAAITFIKGISSTDNVTPVTKIESRGYNFCKTPSGQGLGPDTSNPKVVERAMRLTYIGM